MRCHRVMEQDPTPKKGGEQEEEGRHALELVHPVRACAPPAADPFLTVEGSPAVRWSAPNAGLR